jgi:carbonic anhydrase/acetyltransferase-like protein (isoleucine patch superfamily)
MPVLSYLDHQPEVAGSVFVAPNAYVVGRVRLGAESSLWFGATVRGDTGTVEIGEGVNVQEGATIHSQHDSPTVLGDDVSLGHLAIVHAATIGNGTLVAMQASVLSGAQVGAGSIIAAHALVPEGMVVPPLSLVMGIPGKVVRQVTENEAERAARTARVYRRLAKEYRAISTWPTGR